MDREEINKVNLKKILLLSRKIEVYLNKEMDSEFIEIVEWTRNAIVEIQLIQRKLRNIKLLDYAYKEKNITDIKISKTEDVKHDILSIYLYIDEELNNWRSIYLLTKLGKIGGEKIC